MIQSFSMCKEAPVMDIIVSSNIDDILPLAPKPRPKKEKKTKKQKKTTGLNVVQTIEEGKQSIPVEQQAGYTIIPGFNRPPNPEYLSTYEELMFQDMLGCASMEPPLGMPADLEQVALQEYLMDARKPLHTHFVLPHQGKRPTCPVYFGSADNKQNVLIVLCNEMHTKIQLQWGNLACDYGLVPILKLSQTPKNLNKVFLRCPKIRKTRCGYFQWIHQSPKPNYVPKAASPSALKKRLNDMVQERMQKLLKVEKTEGGFKFL